MKTMLKMLESIYNINKVMQKLTALQDYILTIKSHLKKIININVRLL